MLGSSSSPACTVPRMAEPGVPSPGPLSCCSSSGGRQGQDKGFGGFGPEFGGPSRASRNFTLPRDSGNSHGEGFPARGRSGGDAGLATRVPSERREHHNAAMKQMVAALLTVAVVHPAQPRCFQSPIPARPRPPREPRPHHSLFELIHLLRRAQGNHRHTACRDAGSRPAHRLSRSRGADGHIVLHRPPRPVRTGRPSAGTRISRPRSAPVKRLKPARPRLLPPSTAGATSEAFRNGFSQTSRAAGPPRIPFTLLADRRRARRRRHRPRTRLAHVRHRFVPMQPPHRARGPVTHASGRVAQERQSPENPMRFRPSGCRPFALGLRCGGHAPSGGGAYRDCRNSRSFPARRNAAPSISVPQIRLMSPSARVRSRAAATAASDPQARRMMQSTSRYVPPRIAS